jgi:hypothetical protein
MKDFRLASFTNMPHDEDKCFEERSRALTEETVVSDCDLDLQSNSSSQASKSVRFSVVTLREYAVTLGNDSYSVHDYPMTMDWSHTQGKILDVLEYEATRKSSQGNARRLSVAERLFRISTVSGTSRKEIQTEELKRCQEVIKKRIQEDKQIRAEASKDANTETKPRGLAKLQKFIKATKKALVLR